MPGTLRDYWWAALVVPVAVVVTGVLVVAMFGGQADSRADRAHAVEAPAATDPSMPASPDPAATADAVACRSVGRGKTVAVSISRQRMWLCDDNSLVRASPITTGVDTPVDRTPTGTWRIVSRETDRYLVGADYRVFVKYWLPFFGDYGFHDSPWQKFPYGDPRYRSAGSRGCVHVPEPAMAQLFAWTGVGTTVTIQA